MDDTPLQPTPNTMHGISRTSITTVVLLLAAGACATPAPETAEAAPQEIHVDGLDYAFGMDEAVGPGPAEVTFTNAGEVDHEMVMVRLRPGATMNDVSEAMAAGSDPREFIDGVAGILIAGPGETSLASLQMEFEAGRTYLMLCNFTDTPDAPPHIALGMIRGFSVAEA